MQERGYFILPADTSPQRASSAKHQIHESSQDPRKGLKTSPGCINGKLKSSYESPPIEQQGGQSLSSGLTGLISRTRLQDDFIEEAGSPLPKISYAYEETETSNEELNSLIEKAEDLLKPEVSLKRTNDLISNSLDKLSIEFTEIQTKKLEEPDLNDLLLMLKRVAENLQKRIEEKKTELERSKKDLSSVLEKLKDINLDFTHPYTVFQDERIQSIIESIEKEIEGHNTILATIRSKKSILAKLTSFSAEELQEAILFHQDPIVQSEKLSQFFDLMETITVAPDLSPKEKWKKIERHFQAFYQQFQVDPEQIVRDYLNSQNARFGRHRHHHNWAKQVEGTSANSFITDMKSTFVKLQKHFKEQREELLEEKQPLLLEKTIRDTKREKLYRLKMAAVQAGHLLLTLEDLKAKLLPTTTYLTYLIQEYLKYNPNEISAKKLLMLIKDKEIDKKTLIKYIETFLKGCRLGSLSILDRKEEMLSNLADLLAELEIIESTKNNLKIEQEKIKKIASKFDEIEPSILDKINSESNVTVFDYIELQRACSRQNEKRASPIRDSVAVGAPHRTRAPVGLRMPPIERTVENNMNYIGVEDAHSTSAS